jgi:hypothetical protein
MDWSDDQVKILLRPIMASGAKVNALRNATVRADMDFREIVDPYILADPAVFADRQPPRKFNSYSRFDVDAFSDFCAE